MSDDLKWQRRKKLLGDRSDSDEEKEEKKNPLIDDAKMEMELFDAVRSYIRDNDVNEFMVAEHFDIPVARVKEWIRQGRIEYKESNGSTAAFSGGGYCFNCGKHIEFGNLCSKCKREMDGKSNIKGFAAQPEHEEGKLRSGLRSHLK